MTIYERIILLASENGLTPTGLETKCGMTRGKMTQWKQGRQRPGLDALICVADFFNVSIDYLVGRTSKMEVNR